MAAPIQWALVITAVRTDPTRVVLQLEGDVDLTNAEFVTAMLEEHLALGRRYVRLDLSRLGLLDCAGLTALAQAHKTFLAARGTLVLTGVGPRIARLLRESRLDETLFIADGPGEPRRSRAAGHSVTTRSPSLRNSSQSA